MSQIIFLGTGGGKNILASQLRSTAGIVIRTDNDQIHLDPGPGALIKSKTFGVDPLKTNIILLSSRNLDHCNDANVLMHIMTNKCNKKNGHLIANPGFSDSSILNKKQIEWLDRVVFIEPNMKIKHNDIEIVATETKTNDEKAVGFKIYTKDFVLGYTSDTDYLAKIAKSYEDVNILIINALKPMYKPVKGHLCSGKITSMLSKIRPKLAVLTHFGTEMINSNPLYEAREIQKSTGVQTIVAHDGMVIDPRSYSVKIKQKNLNSF